MRIALTTDGVYPYVLGGIQRHSSMLLKHLPVHGVELVVFHTAYSESAIQAAKNLDGFSEEIKSQVEHVFVEYPKRAKFPGHYIYDSHNYSKRLLEKFMDQDKAFDFVYAQGLTGRAFIEAKRNGRSLPPIGVNCHGYEMFQHAANLRNKLEHLLLRRTFARITQQADYVFSFSGKIRAIIGNRLAVSSDKIIEIPNAVEASWIRTSCKPSRRKRRFVFLGRYERRKGIEELHEVLSRWDGSEVEFVFIGPIPGEEQLNLPWVNYLGPIFESESLKKELDRGDVLVCPSYSEGMPTVILEAMARGLAIVATDVGAVSGIVSDANGYLISKLSVKSLESALLKISSLAGHELDELKKASLKKVSKYTWDEVSLDTLNSIQSVVFRK